MGSGKVGGMAAIGKMRTTIKASSTGSNGELQVRGGVFGDGHDSGE